eukprot:GEMP01017732.1.p1 GENE.GEMP01017732.1~~GEMP01017732.1.p1  ORF type:complete len:507 (+),score=88.91 GEMP01017732.1:253-1773(+)
MLLPIGKNHSLPNVELNQSASRGRRLRQGYVVKVILGQGAFGLVKLVRRKEDGRLFAMKVIDKWSILESRRIDPFAEQYVRNELKIGVMVRDLHSPFLAKLCSAFQTEEKLYYLLDYYPGGELFNVLESRYPSGLPGDTTVIYVAEITCALRALHGADVLHRDVRLENVLLDAEGHVRLCDYGLALLLNNPNIPFMQRRTKEVYVGANAIFQPPETYTDKGYGAGLDFWQLGIMTYVMCTGHFPPPSDTPRRSAKILEQLQNRVETHPELPSFIVCLLDEREETRLGYVNGTDELMLHDLFHDMDWGAVTSTAKNQHLIDVGDHSEEDVTDECAHIRDSAPTNYQQDLLAFRNFTFMGSRENFRTSKSVLPEDGDRGLHINHRALLRYSSKTFDTTRTSEMSSAGSFRGSLRYSGATSSTEDKRTTERSPYIASEIFKCGSYMSTIVEKKIITVTSPRSEEYNIMNENNPVLLDSGDELSEVVEDEGCASDTGSLVLTIPKDVKAQ